LNVSHAKLSKNHTCNVCSNLLYLMHSFELISAHQWLYTINNQDPLYRENIQIEQENSHLWDTPNWVSTNNL